MSDSTGCPISRLPPITWTTCTASKGFACTTWMSGLKRLGVAKGEVVVLYLPMIPEAVIFMLACARIGAIHCVVFSGFSAHALADRIADTGAAVVVTADGGYRRGDTVPLKQTVDTAVEQSPGVRKVVVVRHT